jgi:hypothetical protein
VQQAIRDLDSSLNAPLYITAGVSCILLGLMFEFSATILTYSESKTNATLAAYLCLMVGVVSVGSGVRECFAAVPATRPEPHDLEAGSIFTIPYAEEKELGPDSGKK